MRRVKKKMEVVNWGCTPVGKWLSRHEISMGYLLHIYIYMYNFIYVYMYIYIHIVCTLYVGYGMVLIHLETGSHHREPHDGRLGQHSRFPMDISIFLVGDIPSLGQWGYNADEVGHPVIFLETYPLVI